jgi:hypothetical protein
MLFRYVPYECYTKMTELIATIDDIVKFGLQPNLSVADRDKALERNLVKIYSLYFHISYQFDSRDFPDFSKSGLPDIRHNVTTNFPEFGFYKTVLDYDDIDNLKECGIGDAVDDLTDIINDLLEIKWRIENNSLADGLWFFDLIFKGHTQQHILDLLNYMKQKNG